MKKKVVKNNLEENTVILVKPDGVKRGLIGEVITRFEKLGLNIAAMKMVWVDQEFVGKHYRDDPKWYKSVGDKLLDFYKEIGYDIGESLGSSDPIELGRMVRKWLFVYITEGPVVAMLIKGPHAVELVRKIVGTTYPLNSPPGTIRGDLWYDSPTLANIGQRSVRNIIHASGSVEEAEFERKLWFKEDEIYDY